MSVRLVVLLIAFSSAVSIFAQKPEKRNSRPTEHNKNSEVSLKAGPPVYFYQFEKEEFHISRVWIEHDENGLGKIRFKKKDLEEEFVKTLRLSQATLELLTNHWNNLDFINSSSNYQSKNEYPHLGTMRLSMSRDGRERTAEFNWTTDTDARALTEEYKKLGYQYVWMFDIDVARRNQPLESPRIMQELDKYLRRGSISDPVHMLPYLRELGDDERMPLIARNHAKRLAESIRKKHEPKN